MKNSRLNLNVSIFLWIFPLFFCANNLLFSQERQALQGQIIADSIAEAQVNIVNLTAETGTVNYSNGNFEINAKKGDTLLFSSLLYNPYQLPVTDSILKVKNLKVHLIVAVTILEEVKISNNNLKGDLTKDVKTVHVFDQAKVGFPLKGKKLTTAQRRIYTASTGPSGGGIVRVPIDPIINILSGRMAMLKRQRKYEKIETKKSKTLSALSLDFFVKTLKIPKTRVEDFVYFCMQSKGLSELLVPEKKLELVEFLSEKAKAYKEQNKIK